MLPPAHDMPMLDRSDVVEVEPLAEASDAWRALVEVRIETIRPGSHAIDDDPIVELP